MEIKKVGVLGCGLMGHGIAQVAAQAGYDVVVREIAQEKLDKGLGKVEKQLARAVEKEKVSQEDADAVRGRIQGTLDYGDLAESDLVIEAITEDLGLKLEMWREVDSVVKDGALFATNTSSLPVIDQAAATGRPESFFGLHFFNPAQVMQLVEVVRCVTTSDEAFEAGKAFTESINKLGIPTKDKAGFIVNRLLVPYMLDAIRAFEEGVGSISEIDEAMKAGAGPDGTAHARRLRRPRHHGRDLRGDVRRVPRAPLRQAADAAQDAGRRLVRAQERQGLLRLLGRGAGRKRRALTSSPTGRTRRAAPTPVAIGPSTAKLAGSMIAGKAGRAAARGAGRPCPRRDSAVREWGTSGAAPPRDN